MMRESLNFAAPNRSDASSVRVQHACRPSTFVVLGGQEASTSPFWNFCASRAFYASPHASWAVPVSARRMDVVYVPLLRHVITSLPKPSIRCEPAQTVSCQRAGRYIGRPRPERAFQIWGANLSRATPIRHLSRLASALGLEPCRRSRSATTSGSGKTPTPSRRFSPLTGPQPPCHKSACSFTPAQNTPPVTRRRIRPWLRSARRLSNLLQARSQAKDQFIVRLGAGG